MGVVSNWNGVYISGILTEKYTLYLCVSLVWWLRHNLAAMHGGSEELLILVRSLYGVL